MIRNAGGRISPATLQTVAMMEPMRAAARGAGAA